jgi:hypothetical protein
MLRSILESNIHPIQEKVKRKNEKKSKKSRYPLIINEDSSNDYFGCTKYVLFLWDMYYLIINKIFFALYARIRERAFTHIHNFMSIIILYDP